MFEDFNTHLERERLDALQLRYENERLREEFESLRHTIELDRERMQADFDARFQHTARYGMDFGYGRPDIVIETSEYGETDNEVERLQQLVLLLFNLLYTKDNGWEGNKYGRNMESVST